MNKLHRFLVILAFSYAVIATVYVVDTRIKLKGARVLYNELMVEVDKQDQLKSEYYQLTKDAVAYSLISIPYNSPNYVKDIREVVTNRGFNEIEARFALENTKILLNNKSNELYGVNLATFLNMKGDYNPFNGKDSFFNAIWK